VVKIISKKITEYKTVIGIMTGTSLDGVDTLVTRIKGRGVSTRHENLCFKVFEIPSALKERMRSIMRDKTAALEEICRINFELASLYAGCIKKICRASGVGIEDIDFAGISGQTFFHVPGEATLQLGSGSALSGILDLPVVWDFRAADIAAGGQGAPLVPYLDFVLFSALKRDIITLNIGGISNITHIPAAGGFHAVKAFDCGPGNMIIDKMVIEMTGGRKKYDKDALIARCGKSAPELFNMMKSHPYLQKAPPKSTGREAFGDGYARGLIDFCKTAGISFPAMIRTAAEFTAYCVIEDIKKHIAPGFAASGVKKTPDRRPLLVCAGGGADNPLIFEALKKGAADAGIETVHSNSMGVDSKSKEALLIAVLANETIYGHASNAPSATGAKKSVVCGSVAYQPRRPHPKNARRIK